MFAYIYKNTSSAITKAYSYLANAVKYLDDSKDPFEAGDIVETREIVEYAEVEAPQLPAELITEILSKIKDPEKISNLMQINRTWYREGSRRLNKDRDELMEWLRLNRIEQLDHFIRYLKLDRLDEYTRINNSFVNEYKEAQKHIEKVREERNIAYKIFDEYRKERDTNSDSNAEEEDLITQILFDEEFGFLQDDDGDNEWDPNDEEELIPPNLFDEEYEELNNIYRDKCKEFNEAVLFSADLNDQRLYFRDFVYETVTRGMSDEI